jgi:hypothetical protein
MRRLFWLAMGVTVGAIVARKLTRAAERLTPRGLAGSLGGGLAELASAVRAFTVDVRSAMTEREAQLREDTGLEPAHARTESP